MLEKNEVEKIKELIQQGKSNYRIGKEIGCSPNTANNIRKTVEKTEKKQTQGVDVRFNSPIDGIKGIVTEIENLLETEKLSEREKKEWGEREKRLKEIIRIEVDERIAKERADAIEKTDQEWNVSLEQSYVKKEVETNLKITIQEIDATILNLRKIIEEKDAMLTRYTRYIQQQQNKMENLENVNLEQNNYIENRLEKDVIIDQKQIDYARETLNTEKTRFTIDVNTQLSNLEILLNKIDEMRKANETWEKHLNEREEKIKKREDELETK
jgi:hypothetical protein